MSKEKANEVELDTNFKYFLIGALVLGVVAILMLIWTG